MTSSIVGWRFDRRNYFQFTKFEIIFYSISIKPCPKDSLNSYFDANFNEDFKLLSRRKSSIFCFFFVEHRVKCNDELN